MITAGPANRARLTAVQTLRAEGVASPEYDAAELLAFVLDIQRGLLPIAKDLNEDQARQYDALVVRRARREPLQHIIGSAGFYGLALQVGPGVFIPRPETEVLVERALSAIAAVAAPRVVDLCAGSGAVALAIASNRPTAQIVAVEQSSEAVTWLRRNVEQLAPQVHVVHSNVLALRASTVNALMDSAHPGDGDSGDQPTEGGVDLVTCNPPYVPSRSAVEHEVAAHDPGAAVFAGEDGLELIRPLVGLIAELLRPGGTVVLEHDESHQPQVLRLFGDSGSFTAVTGHQDLTRRPRFITATRG